MRGEKHMTGYEVKKCSSFHSEDKLRSNLKNLFSSYLLQLREARRREELPESYFTDSLSSRELQHCCCPKLKLIHSQLVPLTVTAAANQTLSTCKPEGCWREARAQYGERWWWRGETRWRRGEAKPRARESQMRSSILYSQGTGCIWDSAFPYL